MTAPSAVRGDRLRDQFDPPAGGRRHRARAPAPHAHHPAGAGRGPENALAPDAIARTVGVLEDYRRSMDRYGVERIRMVATSAVRDAENGAAFTEAAKAAVGVEPEVLSGTEEGVLAFRGASADLDAFDGDTLVVDIGGGSTEITLGRAGAVSSVSLQLGCVRLTERFLKGDPPDRRGGGGDARRRYADALRARGRQLPALMDLAPARRMIGLAGTVSTLASLKLGIAEYDAEKLHHVTITLSEIEEMCGVLSSLSNRDRGALVGMVPGPRGRAPRRCAGSRRSGAPAMAVTRSSPRKRTSWTASSSACSERTRAPRPGLNERWSPGRRARGPGSRRRNSGRRNARPHSSAPWPTLWRGSFSSHSWETHAKSSGTSANVEPSSGIRVRLRGAVRRNDDRRSETERLDALAGDDAARRQVDGHAGMGQQPPQVGAGEHRDHAAQDASPPDGGGGIFDDHDLQGGKPGREPGHHGGRRDDVGCTDPVREDEDVAGEARAHCAGASPRGD